MSEILSQIPRPAIELACLGVGILVLMIIYALVEKAEWRKWK